MNYVAADGAITLELLASAARTATGTGPEISGMSRFTRAVVELDVTAAATETGDKLDVYLQKKTPSGKWVDFVHFTQVAGDGGAKSFLANLATDVAPTAGLHGTDQTVAAGTAQQGPWADVWRVRWDVTAALVEANESFTFGVQAQVSG